MMQKDSNWAILRKRVIVKDSPKMTDLDWPMDSRKMKGRRKEKMNYLETEMLKGLLKEKETNWGI